MPPDLREKPRRPVNSDVKPYSMHPALTTALDVAERLKGSASHYVFALGDVAWLFKLNAMLTPFDSIAM